jgi:chorismate synthase
MASTFGRLFSVTTYGESHGQGVGAVVDGCPAGLALGEAEIQIQLDRRRPGQSELTSPRDEPDRVAILSGLEDGRTLGTPITLHVGSRDQRPADYGAMGTIPRPSHADYTYQMKYGVRSRSGGGRASARETVGRVAAGAVAEKLLRTAHGVDIVAWVQSVGDVAAPELDLERLTRAQVDTSAVRCPDPGAARSMADFITATRAAGDSIGAVVGCVCRGLPAGWGEPVFDKLEALLAHAMLSIPATKGFEIGSGFAGTHLRGSEHNDPFVLKGARLGTLTNHSGGVQGGISNGEPVVFRVAFKPPATIGRPQSTADFEGRDTVLEAKGRHDPCVAPRAVPIVEAMAALVLADLALRQMARK